MKKKLPYIFLFLSVIGFVVWKYVHRSVVLEKQPIILGHGGMGVRSPYTLNSKRSVEVALAYPIDGTEIDVRMTSDNVLIAYHDEEFQVYTGCPGPIWEKTYAEIYACSYGVFHKSAPIEALDTLLAFAGQEGSVFSLDLKPNRDSDSLGFAQYRSAIKELIDKFPQFTFLIESQDLTLLSDLKEMNVRGKLFYYAHSGAAGIENVTARELDGISINAALITKQEIAEAQKANIEVMIWGTGSVFSNRKILDMNADIVQTDAIASMVRILDR